MMYMCVHDVHVCACVSCTLCAWLIARKSGGVGGGGGWGLTDPPISPGCACVCMYVHVCVCVCRD